MLYESFRHAQGDQALQVHFISSYARILRENGVPIDFTARVELAARMRTRRLPSGHMDIANSALVGSQFEFWWLNLWDILESVYTGSAEPLPSPEQLAARVVAVGGTERMSSYAAPELAHLNEGFAPYRDAGDPARTAREIILERFLPNLIRVERNFQGYGSRYRARPRTDGGDAHEAKLLGHCRRARKRVFSVPRDPVDQIYLEASARLTWLALHEPADATFLDYLQLVEAYNRNHVSEPLADLHAANPDNG
ncbi:hypothetical protein [Pseudonocardia acaciae]|uniref:hypothetical protein n=1 Tax=Pseudonocardia acaciae TaxID=551276 RepID=UPI00048D5745|nr:hypothetical protein [Pseudonocardia acaciae]